MGKDLHYSIRPFIERALTNHNAVKEIKDISTDKYFAYRIKRNFGLSDIIVVLSDAYYFGESVMADRMEIFKNGGFYLIARPEARGYETNIIKEKIGIGQIGKLLGAINQEEFWTYKRRTD